MALFSLYFNKNIVMKASSLIFISILIALNAFIGCNKAGSLSEEVKALEDSLSTTRIELEEMGLNYGRLLEQTNLMEGVFFEVQIGAFEYFDLSQYNESIIRLRNGKHEGLNKYLLGRFIDYNEAIKFKKDIKTMGVKDAFIVGYVDGERVEINVAKKAAKKTYGI